MGLKTWIRTRKKESRLLPKVVGAARVGAAGHIASAMAGRIGVLALNAENSVLQEVEMVVSQIRPRRFSGVEVGWLIKRPFQSVSLGVLRTSSPLECRTCVGWLFCFVVPSVSIPAVCFPCWLLLNIFFCGLSAVAISVVVIHKEIFFTCNASVPYG